MAVSIAVRYVLTVITFSVILACSSGDRKSTEALEDTPPSEQVEYPLDQSSIIFNAKCIHLCDDEKGLFLDQRKFMKYGYWNPYDTVQTSKGDTTMIAFDFIADCCLDFSGHAVVFKDTLVLSYGLADTLAGCDCSCDYRMVYSLNNRAENWSAVKIDNRDGKNPWKR